MIKYEISIDDFGNEMIVAEQENGKILFIPSDSGNSDYQRYLRSLENPDG